MTGATVPGVPGACEVVKVRAARLTEGHVIRLHHGQGAYTPPGPEDLPYGKVAYAIHSRWREVLSIYHDYDSLEAEHGAALQHCTHEGCRAWLAQEGHWANGGVWRDGEGNWRNGGPAKHEHEAGPAGQLQGALAALARQAFEDGYGQVVIRVLLAEASTSGEIADVFIRLDKHDLVEAQSLPAEGMESTWAGALAGIYPADWLGMLVRAAGKLWDETGDPDGVLSTAQADALDLAAVIYRARQDGEDSAEVSASETRDTEEGLLDQAGALSDAIARDLTRLGLPGERLYETARGLIAQLDELTAALRASQAGAAPQGKGPDGSAVPAAGRLQ